MLMKSEKRNLSGLVALLLCAAILGGMGVLAADGRLCSLTVYTPGEYLEDLRDAEYKISLFRVAAAPVWDGEYTPTEGFEKLAEKPEDGSASLMEKLNADHSRDTLKEAAALALELAEDLEPTAELTVAKGADFGKAEGLQPGLYLLRMEDAYTDLWHYSGMVSAVFLPGTREEVHDEESIRVHDDTAVDLYYDLEIYAKMERTPNVGDLIIEKTVDRFEKMAQEAVAVFEVKAVHEGKVVYNQLKTLIFTEPGKKTAVVTGLPVGAKVTVTEIYSGSGFHLVGENPQTVTITATEDDEEYRPVQVSFKNEGGDHDGGTAVINRFDFNGEGWIWVRNVAEDQLDDEEIWTRRSPEEEGGAETNE